MMISEMIVTESLAVGMYRNLVMQSSLAQMEQAAVWYFEAQAVAEQVAINLDVSLEVGASIVAAFSPRERWSSNVSKAIAYSLGHRPKGLQNNLAMADNAMANGFDALNGLKTNAFARAIAGDSDAVVIDVWMCRAANLGSDSPNKSQYTMLADAVKSVAAEFDISPRTTQALIWIVVRGGHQ